MSGLFRKKALDKLATLDRLDERVALIAPRRWMALAALLVALGVAALWGALGRISTRVNGSGMLLEPGGFRNVVSASEGAIDALHAQEGSLVEEGEVLGSVALPLQEMELGHLRGKLELLRAELAEWNAAAESNRAQRLAFVDGLRADNAEIIGRLASLQEQVTRLAEACQDPVGRDFAALSESLRKLQDLANASVGIARQRQEDWLADVDPAGSDLGVARELWRIKRQLKDAEHELQLNTARFTARSRIVSPARGVIVHAQKSAGDNVSAGETVFLLQPSIDGPLHASAFIPAAMSKSVRAGQRVYVSPANIEPQRAGYMLGTVERVGRYPATFEQLMNVFKNRDLTRRLKGDEVAVTLEASLIPDDGNPTGYRWTGAAPEGVRVSAGTLCTVAVVVESRPPLSYVLPWMREKWLGDVKREAGGVRGK